MSMSEIHFYRSSYVHALSSQNKIHFTIIGTEHRNIFVSNLKIFIITFSYGKLLV